MSVRLRCDRPPAAIALTDQTERCAQTLFVFNHRFPNSTRATDAALIRVNETSSFNCKSLCGPLAELLTVCSQPQRHLGHLQRGVAGFGARYVTTSAGWCKNSPRMLWTVTSTETSLRFHSGGCKQNERRTQSSTPRSGTTRLFEFIIAFNKMSKICPVPE